MQRWMIYLIISIIFVIFFILFFSLKKNYIKKMSKILYVDNNPDLFLTKLNGFEGKFFINYKIRLFRMIDAYVLKQDNEKTLNTFKTLEKLKLSFGQQVSLYEKEVNYYIQNNMYEEAIIADNHIQELNKKVEIEDLKKIAVNSSNLIKIFVNKDGSLANDMVKIAEKSNINAIKGTYYYYAAKCYHYRNDNKMVDKYLNKALKYLEGSSMYNTINSSIKDYTKLD